MNPFRECLVWFAVLDHEYYPGPLFAAQDSSISARLEGLTAKIGMESFNLFNIRSRDLNRRIYDMFFIKQSDGLWFLDPEQDLVILKLPNSIAVNDRILQKEKAIGAFDQEKSSSEIRKVLYRLCEETVEPVAGVEWLPHVREHCEEKSMKKELLQMLHSFVRSKDEENIMESLIMISLLSNYFPFHTLKCSVVSGVDDLPEDLKHFKVTPPQLYMFYDVYNPSEADSDDSEDDGPLWMTIDAFIKRKVLLSETDERDAWMLQRTVLHVYESEFTIRCSTKAKNKILEHFHAPDISSELFSPPSD